MESGARKEELIHRDGVRKARSGEGGEGRQICRTGHEAPQYTIAGCFIKSH